MRSFFLSLKIIRLLMRPEKKVRESDKEKKICGHAPAQEKDRKGSLKPEGPFLMQIFKGGEQSFRNTHGKSVSRGLNPSAS